MMAAVSFAKLEFIRFRTTVGTAFVSGDCSAGWTEICFVWWFQKDVVLFGDDTRQSTERHNSSERPFRISHVSSSQLFEQ
jgi:hypothetical protein